MRKGNPRNAARTLPAFGTLLAMALLLGLFSCQQGCPFVNTVLPNYLPILVGPQNSQFTTPNIPFVSVTICVPGTTNCQTLDNIQVDTGSPGLRIFSQALTVNLPTEQSGGNPLGECVSFGVGNTWGSVATASVTLGSEPAVTVPIQVIDATFGTSSPPFACSSGLFTSPSDMSANGLLGIMPVQSDTGVFVPYFTCKNGSCSEFSPAPAQTVQNPVFLLPQDNNGVLVYLDSISDQGVAQAYGSLVLGIGTTPNNDPNFISSGNPYKCMKASSFSFDTNYEGQDLPLSLIDSGSNMLFFPDSSLPQCNIFLTKIFCPNPAVWKSATLTDNVGNSQKVNFLVGDPTLGTNMAFDDLGAPVLPSISFGFDWGLPFFYGRSIFIAYGSSSSSVCGAGGISIPEWGYAPLPQNSSPQLAKILRKAREAQHPMKH